ncbi:hypothetical protein DLE60_21885 [Micromonospora globispora]|uniref:Uncharacterized protein n=1 Tax=Micromonospora globispora TaxID=1450148 RepID=A0A317K2C4_9ACTN|nr:hypothetical protein DLJ46_16900 [Micromonospora globispora]PWU58421.1 hypothetical protein DLE60_21885 [Micromonospora globispora]RQW96051.1 hypothetical protein DKL51_13970 [Micromonospora globispora]
MRHTGPVSSAAPLPSRLVRLTWSGLTEFDVTDSRQRLTLYLTLMDCGQRNDIVRYVNAALLRRDWPRIRRLTARRVIAVWERRPPELAA